MSEHAECIFLHWEMDLVAEAVGSYTQDVVCGHGRTVFQLDALEKSDIGSLLHRVTFDNFQLSVPAPEKKCSNFDLERVCQKTCWKEIQV